MSSCGGLSLGFETWDGSDLSSLGTEAKEYFLNPPSFSAGVMRASSALGLGGLVGAVVKTAGPGIAKELLTSTGRVLAQGTPVLRIVPSIAAPLIIASSNPVIAESTGMDPAVISALQAYATAKQGLVANQLIHNDEFVKAQLEKVGIKVNPKKAVTSTQLVSDSTRRSGLSTMGHAKKTVTDVVGDLKAANRAIKHKEPFKVKMKVPRAKVPGANPLGKLTGTTIPDRYVELEPFKGKPRTGVGRRLHSMQKSGQLKAGSKVFKAGAKLPLNVASTAGKFTTTAAKGVRDLARGTVKGGAGIAVSGAGAALGGLVLDQMTDAGYTKDIINAVSGTDITQEQAERHTEDFLTTELPLVGDVGVPLDPLASYAKAGGAVANLQEINEERGLHEDGIVAESRFVRDQIDDTALGVTPLPELAGATYFVGKGAVNTSKAVGSAAVGGIEGTFRGAKTITGFIPLTPW